MSYDISFFKPIKGKTVEESAEEVLGSDDNNAFSNRRFEEIKKQIQDKFHECGFKCDVSEAEGTIEFTFPSEIQIFLSKNQGTLSLPYYRNKSDKKLKEAFAYLKIIRDETGFSFYDSQIGSEIDLNEGPSDQKSAYKSVAKQTSLNTSKPLFRNKWLFYVASGVMIVFFLTTQSVIARLFGRPFAYGFLLFVFIFLMWFNDKYKPER
jgi:hypothetical protein